MSPSQVDEYLGNVKKEMLETAKEDIAMNLEIFTPFTEAYEDNLYRLRDYQKGYLKYNEHQPGMNNTGGFGGSMEAFKFDETRLLCCDSQEMEWIQQVVEKAKSDTSISQCLLMMNSLAAYLKSVCDCTLEYTSKKVLRKFVSKVSFIGFI